MMNQYGMSPQQGYGFQLPNWGNMGNWGTPNAVPALTPGYTNAMDLMSDNFSTSGLKNAGGLGFGQNAPAAGGGFLSGFMGTKDAPGWGGMAVGGIGALTSAFLGMKQYGLAKDTLAENKKQFDLNFGAQRTMTNSNLEDRQRARVASNSGAYQSVGDYMQQNGVR